MAISKILRTTAKAMGGILLSLMGGWLGVVCVGGLVTLGVLSLFHLGVLLSLGCIGVCLLIAGACILHQLLSKATSSPAAIEDHALATKFKEKPVLDAALSRRTYYTAPFHPSRPDTKPTENKKSAPTDQNVPSKKTPSLNPFDE